MIPWDNYEQELNAMALHGQGTEVSQVGDSLIDDLLAMKAWKSIRDETDAVNLVRCMLGDEAQRNYCLKAGFLPVRLSVLNETEFSMDPVLKTFAQAALNGRTISPIKLSGLREDLLSTAVSHIWERITAKPTLDLGNVIRDELNPIVHRAKLWSD